MILISTSVIDFRPTYALPDQERPGGIQVILDANASVLFNRKQLLQPYGSIKITQSQCYITKVATEIKKEQEHLLSCSHNLSIQRFSMCSMLW